MKKNNYSVSDHTFVICAYKECQFLEECITSLKQQSRKSKILIATSTPNDFILELAEKHGISVNINTGEAGIAGDWNFGLHCADTALITLAHQDDVYKPNYTEKMLQAMNRAEAPLLFFCSSNEILNGEETSKSRLVRIKKAMCLPLHFFPKSRGIRRSVLSLGNPIPCPGVTYVRDVIRKHPYDSAMKSNLDWAKWEELSKLEGSFVYERESLLCHRIHPEAETSRIVREHARTAEDYDMFRKFWPKPIARVIARVYSAGEEEYR